MPHEEELHHRLTRLEDQRTQIENRMVSIDERHKRFEEAVIDISRTLGKFEAIAEDLISLKPKIDKIEAIDARLEVIEKAHEQQNEGYVNLLLNYKVWIITSIIVLVAKYGWGMSIATFNNK